ncbi:MAG: hypothetical protein KF773_05335 [Deltaproteobacteria bacterium]|nr:hypothetical protein [Deltaproteobacteria bacterium]
MRIPIWNGTKKEMLLGLEPEGHALPIGPGEKLVLVAANELCETLEIEIEDGLLSVCVMGRRNSGEGTLAWHEQGRTGQLMTP